jgi:hypothetical protein
MAKGIRMKLQDLSKLLRYVLVVTLCVGCCTLFSTPARAQSTYGAISGMITDASGGSIAGVQVTLTSLATSAKQSQTTGADGLYLFSNLFVGHYRIDAEKKGFKRTSQTDVEVAIQQTSAINLTMQVGDVAQTIEVTSETPLFEPDNSSLGQIVDQRKANEIPLNGRNVFNLASLSPSVVPQGNSQGSIVGKNPFDLGNYQIGGSFANQGAQYLDGQPLNIGYINIPLVTPTQDSIAEFKVQYNNLGPEWGKFSGGVINFSTKSGTNSWHGTAAEFLRNRVLDANEFFLKTSELASGKPNKAPPFTQNQFGASVGGAIFKDKTFVFGSYEGYRARVGAVFSSIVPTAAERTGNFADICKNGFGGPVVQGVATCADTVLVGGVTTYVDQLYNPLTSPAAGGQRTPIAGNDMSATGPTGGLNPVPQVLPGSATPVMAPYLNPTATYLLGKLIANPTNTSIAPLGLLNPSSGSSNFTAGTSTGGDIDQYVVRGDQNLTASQHLFGRFTYFKELSLAQDPYGTGLCKDRCAENTRSKSLAVGWSDAISPTLTASINASISRYHYLRGPILSGFDVTQEGWPAAYNGVIPTGERTPLTPCFANSDSGISCSQGQSAIDDHDTQFNISPQFTKIVGRHTIFFGGQLEMTYDNYLQTNNGGGIISFNGSWTAPSSGGATAAGGIDYADFLLGYGLGAGAAFGNQTTGNLIISAPVASKETYRALFVGDTWRFNSKLTINAGLRYELAGPFSERFDRITYFDPNAVSASTTGCSGVAGSPCAGDLFYVNTGVNDTRNGQKLPKKEFSPRLGIAYAWNPKTVIRAGYGIFFAPNNVAFSLNPYGDPLNSATSTFFAGAAGGAYPTSTLNNSSCTLAGAGGVGNNYTCTEPGPFGPVVNAPAARNAQPNISTFGVNQSPLTTNGYTIGRPAYNEQYNLDIQRELPWGIFLDIAYAGSHGVHLQQYQTDLNQISDSMIANANTQCGPVLTSGPMSGQCSNGPTAVTIAQNVGALNYPFNITLPGATLSPAGLIQGQLDRPYPQYLDVKLAGVGCCESIYNSFQLSGTKRFAGGGTLLVAYTNAKLISNTDTLTSWLEGSGNGGTGGVQDWNNLKGEMSLSSQDVSQRLVISYVLDLPFGHGKKYMSDLSGPLDKVVAGWGVDGVTTFQKGFPLKISQGPGNLLSASSLGIGGLRPNTVPGCSKSAAPAVPAGTIGVNQINPACFTLATGYSFGDESRTDPTLRQAGINNWDFAIFKKTYFGPDNKLNLEFRTEFFNTFNRVQFAAPNTTYSPTSTNFGLVTATNGNPRLIQFGLRFNF